MLAATVPPGAQDDEESWDELAGSPDAAALTAHVSFARPDRPALGPDTNCTAVLSEDAAYFVYQDAVALLMDGTAPEEVPYLSCFFRVLAPEMSAEAALERLLLTSFERNVLLGYLDYEFERVIERVVGQGAARSGFLAWPGTYSSEAALLAYQRTRDPRFLDLYMDFFDRVLQLSDPRLGLRDDYHGRIMNSWGALMPVGILGEEDRRDHVAHVTHFGRIMTPATGFAREILADPETSTRQRRWAYDVVRFFESGWQQFEMDRRDVGEDGLGWYWRPLDDEFEPINHVLSLGRALLPVWEITGDPIYAARIREMITVFEASLDRHPDGTVSWPYSPPFQTVTSLQTGVDTEFSEYTWKAGITLPFVGMAAAAGFEFQPGNLEAVRQLVVGYTLADGEWKRTLHPDGEGDLRPLQRSRLQPSLGGFHMTFPDDPEVAELVQAMMVANLDLYERGWFTDPGVARSYALFLD